MGLYPYSIDWKARSESAERSRPFPTEISGRYIVKLATIDVFGRYMVKLATIDVFGRYMVKPATIDVSGRYKAEPFPAHILIRSYFVGSLSVPSDFEKISEKWQYATIKAS